MSDVTVISNPGRRSEVVEILASSLLDLLLTGEGSHSKEGRKPLISGSQPALLCTDDGAEKPRERARR